MQNLVPDYPSPTELIQLNPPGQQPRQVPIYLCCDWGRGQVVLEVANTSFADTPAYEWQGHRTCWNLPENIDATAIRQWVQDYVVPLADKVQGGYRLREQQGESVAFLTSKAKRHLEMLDQLLDWDSYKVSIPLLQQGGVVTPELRFWDEAKERVGPSMTDAELEHLAQEWTRELLEAGYVLDGEVLVLLQAVRREMENP